MKKFTVLAAVVCAVMLVAAPAMAVDLGLSGFYDAQGWFLDNQDLDDNTSGSNAWLKHDFQLDPVFKVHDNLKVVTRLKVFEDQIWGQLVPDKNPGPGPTAQVDSDYINWKMAYLEAKFGIGTLAVGRMIGPTSNGAFGPFGTSFCDAAGYADRIKFAMDFSPVHVIAIYDKGIEADVLSGNADSDQDKYYLLTSYKEESYEGGLGLLYVDQSNDTASTGANANLISGETTATSTYDADWYDIVPYFKANTGPVKLEGELSYRFGDNMDYHWDTATTKDLDYDALAYYLRAEYNAGPAMIGLGYAFAEGDVNTTDDEVNNHPCGTEFVPLAILFNPWYGIGDDNFTAKTPTGNFNSDVGIDNNYGYKLLYGDVCFSPMENLNLKLAIGWMEADEVAEGWDDAVGMEYDITGNYNLMDNLNYYVIVGYLDADDFWKGAAKAGAADDTWAVIHGITVSF